MREVRLEVLSREGRDFYRARFGYVRHGSPSFRAWVNRRLVQITGDGSPLLRLGKGMRIRRTEKGNLVIVPSEEHSIVVVGWNAGYRGTSGYEILSPQVVEMELQFEKWSSPRGALGVSTYALLSLRGDRVLVRLWRTGRLYGDPAEAVLEYVATEDGVEEREISPACYEDPELGEALMG